jgi:hypothetical protein
MRAGPVLTAAVAYVGTLLAKSQPVTAPDPRQDVLAGVIDAALERRRIGRAERQAAARAREVLRHHQTFTRDRLVRAARPSLTKGDEHHV